MMIGLGLVSLTFLEILVQNLKIHIFHIFKILNDRVFVRLFHSTRQSRFLQADWRCAIVAASTFSNVSFTLPAKRRQKFKFSKGFSLEKSSTLILRILADSSYLFGPLGIQYSQLQFDFTTRYYYFITGSL